MISISKEDLSEEEFKAVIQSRGFQKMLLYKHLSDGIEVLRTHDRLYESMVRAITEQHDEIQSSDTTREVLSLLQDEVDTYTQPLDADDSDDSDEDMTLDDLIPSDDENLFDIDDNADPREALEQYLEQRVPAFGQIEIKSKEVSSDLGLESTLIGRILGEWRDSSDTPFLISSSDSVAGVNIWTIERAGRGE